MVGNGNVVVDGDSRERFALHPWLIEFRDPAVEAEFQQHHLAWSLRHLRNTLIICGIFYIGFFVTDIAALGWGRDAMLLLGVRILVALTAIMAVSIATRNPQAMIGSGLTATVVEVVGMAAFLVIVDLRPHEMPWHGMAYGLMLLVVYLFIPNRFILSAAVAIASTLGFLLVGYFGGEMSTVELLVLALLLVLANTFGLLASRRYHQLWRTEFQAQTGLMTSVRQLELAKRVAERANIEKTRFLAAASHDLRQPLQALKLFADALGRSPLNSDQLRLVGHLDDSVIALEDILNTLLDISKLESGTVRPVLRPVSVQSVLQRVMEKTEPLLLARHLRGKLFYPRNLIWIETDAVLLMSVLLNVVGNAIKYTGRGGVLVGVRQRNGGLSIEVWDTGIGIHPEHVGRVFDEFFQVANPQRDRSHGVGLGLSIARRICRLLGYEIACRSRPGQGSVFDVWLPPAALSGPPAVTPIVVRPKDGAAGFSGKRFVVLEDDVSVATALRLWLAGQGIAITVYASAEEALADPLALSADCYVVDYQLSGAMDGVDFLVAVRRQSARPVRAVLVSGDISGGFLRRTAEAGWPWMIKPVAPAEILARLVEQANGEVRDATLPPSP